LSIPKGSAPDTNKQNESFNQLKSVIMSHDTELMSKGIAGVVANGEPTIDLPEKVETSDGFIAWAKSKSRPVLFVDKGSLSFAEKFPEHAVEAFGAAYGSEAVPLFPGPQKIENLEVTDNIVRMACKAVREHRKATDIALACYVVNAVKKAVEGPKPSRRDLYSRDDLIEAIERAIPDYHSKVGNLGMMRKVEIAAYHLFVAGDNSSTQASIVRSAAADLDAYGTFKFTDG
jgi:hypothetical protein